MRKPRIKPRMKCPRGFRRAERRLTETEKRRRKLMQDQIDAESKFPVVKSKIDKIRDNLAANIAKGRYGYLVSLKAMLRLSYKWNAKGTLRRRLNIVAKLYGIVPRKDANQFSGLVAACCARDRRIVSRWSLLLDEAFNGQIKPARLEKFARTKKVRS
jgi:hypothetical protein